MLLLNKATLDNRGFSTFKTCLHYYDLSNLFPKPYYVYKETACIARKNTNASKIIVQIT